MTRTEGIYVSRVEPFFLHLAICGILLPVAAQNLTALVLVVGFWSRLGMRRLAAAWAADERVHRIWKGFLHLLFWVWALHLLSLLAELVGLGFAGPLSKVAASEHLRLIGKTGFYGCFIVMVFLFASLRRRKAGIPGPLIRVNWLLGFAGVYLLYMLGQRFYGWDLIHGWNARLGENRFAYGVYRGSGFMGHPLTLAYNAMTLSLLAFGHGLWQWSRERAEAVRWLALSGLMVLVVILSGSRYPSALNLVLIALGLLWYAWRSPRRRLGAWVLIGIAGSLGLLAILARFDPTLYGRFEEMWDASVSWEQRFDRVVFWKVHLAMIADHPIFGVGLASYPEQLLAYYQQTGYGAVERKYHSHNIYLQALAEMGLLGFSALALLLSGLAQAALQFLRESQHVGFALVVLGILLGGIMQNILRDSEFLFALWFCLGLTFTWVIEGRGTTEH